MDPITALGVAASVVQLIEIGAKVTKRLVEFINASPGDVPKLLADIALQLPLITKSLSTIQDESSVSKYDNDTRMILHGTVLGCLKLAQELDHLATKLSPKPGESLSAKLKKVLISLKNEDRMAEINRGLQAYIQVLILHQVVNPKDVEAAPAADVTYYEVKEVRVDNAQRRQVYITKIHEAFRQSSRNQLKKPETVVLAGKEGVGKTQLAVEYCQEARDADHFRAIFWLDASSPSSLKRGLETTSTTIRRTRSGTTEEKLEWLKKFLSELWHSWLLVLDNYEPKAFEIVSLSDLLPAEGHGSILVLTRDLQPMDVAVQIRVHEALTKEDYTSWRRQVSRGVCAKQMDVLIDALADGFDPNSLSADGWNDESQSMVNLAATSGFAEAVQLLLEMGADPYLRKHYGNVLSCAAGEGHVPALRVYLDHEDKTGYRMEDDDYAYAASLCVADNRLDTLGILLKERGDRINGNGKWLAYNWNGGNQNVEIGADKGHLDCIRLMVENNKFPSSPKDRANILSSAIRGRQLAVIRYLLTELHCDPNQLDHDDEPALIPAIDRLADPEAQEDRDTIVSLLLSAGADPDLLGQKWGDPPLHLTTHKRLVSTTKLLLSAGADPRTKSRNGKDIAESLLSRPHYSADPEITALLASAQLPDPAAHRAHKTRLLLLASRAGDRRLAALVLAAADVNAVDPATGETPLLAAIVKGHLPMARMLVRKGAGQDVRDKDGKSPLQLAAAGDMHLLVRDLVTAEGSPGIEAGDPDGYTPLMIAAKAGSVPAVRELLGLGADKEAVNDYGETAMDIAEEARDGDMVALLKGT